MGKSELRLAAVYKSPKTTLLTSDVDALLNSNTYSVVAGDINTHGTVKYATQQEPLYTTTSTTTTT